MYSLVQALWQMYFQKPTFKILIIGLNESGKTHLLTRLKIDANQKAIGFSKIIPTIGLNKKYSALFWDLGGAPLLRSIWKKYYPDCHGIVFVVDQDYATQKEELLKAFESVVNSPDNQDVPILILVNKIDCMENQARPVVDEIESFLSTSLIHNRKILVSACSALKGVNVQESLKMLFQSIIQISKGSNSSN